MNERGLVKIYRTKEQWRELMERYRKSDLTQADFCEREGLSLTSFHKWRDKLQATASLKDSFIELSSRPADVSWRVELELAGGLKVRLR